MNRRSKQKLVMGVILGILYLITAVLRMIDGEILMGVVNLLTALLWGALARLWYLDVKQESKLTKPADQDEPTE